MAINQHKVREQEVLYMRSVTNTRTQKLTQRIKIISNIQKRVARK